MRAARDAVTRQHATAGRLRAQIICQAFPTCSDNLREQGHSLRAAKHLGVLCGDRRSMYFPPLQHQRITRPAILPSAPTHRHAAVGRGQGTYLAALATNSCNTIATGCVASVASTISGLSAHVVRRTGATLGDAKLTTNMLHAGAATRSAQ